MKSDKFPCGHPRSEENVYSFLKDGYINKRCRICKNAQWRAQTAQYAAFRMKERPKTPKYQGQKAGRITIPSFRWGGTRLG